MSDIFSQFDLSYQIRPLHLTCNKTEKKIKEILDGFSFSNDTIDRIAKQFENEMDLSLNEKFDQSSLQMENTYIPELPDGRESGKFLALDLGGTNFRVILIVLENGKILTEIVKKYHIGSHLRIGGIDVATALFDYIGECLCEFVAENDLVAVPLPLGFTFSFPMSQHNIGSATLLAWAKSFNLPTVIGADVVELLRDSLHKLGHSHIEVVSILNDATSTLIQGVNLDKRTRVGIVFGTGSNAAYVESADRVKHWETNHANVKRVCIDIEWGAFGDKGSLDFIGTSFDDILDQTSLLPGAYTYEKYIGGKYLGELARIVFEKLRNENLFCKNTNKSEFPQPWTFDTSLISAIEIDNLHGTNDHTQRVIHECGFVDVNDDDLQIVQYVTALISQRAALLVSITTSVLLRRINEDDITVAIDGSVYKNHPRMHGWLTRLIERFIPNNKTFRLLLVEDGSGKGAALTAAIALRIKNQNTL